MNNVRDRIFHHAKMGLRRTAKKMGYGIEKLIPADLPSHHAEIIRSVEPYTMTSPLRLSSFISAVDYVHGSGVEGSVVECGVWKGGSCMAAMRQLRALGDTDREIYLFDTFEGMSEPTKLDINHYGVNASQEYDNWKENTEEVDIMCYAGLDEVKANVGTVGYPPDKVHYVRGKVEDTLPENAPEKIAILRLDTDWYESTKCELEALWPRLQPGGVIIIDDYGFWEGARKAVDEYLAKHNIHLLLFRVDGTGRMATKPC